LQSCCTQDDIMKKENFDEGIPRGLAIRMIRWVMES
jgi:hypothetical protein